MSGSEERELPEGWVDVRLGDCSEIRSGVGFPHAYQGRTEGDLPFAKVGDVSPAARLTGRLSTAANWISEKDLGPLKAKPIPSGSVVFAKIGEAIRSNLRALTTRPLVTDNNVMAVSPQPQLVLSEYLFAFLKTQDLYPLAVATTVPSLRKSDLEELTLPLPPLNEQKRIVARIDALTEKSREAREALEEVPVLLDKLRQSILAAAFRGDLTREWRAKNPDVEPVSKLLDRVEPPGGKNTGREASTSVIAGRAALSVNDPGTPVPSGWMRVPLLRVARLESGHTPSRKHPEWWGGDIPWIGIGDARDHHGKTIITTSQMTNEDGLANSAARLLPKDTICLSRTASVGYVTKMGRPMATSQDFVNWICTEALNPDYLMYAYLAEGDALRRFGKGSTHTTIYFPEVKAFHVALPPIAEQAEIVRLVKERLTVVETLGRMLDDVTSSLETLDSAILAKAFRGELVPQDPNDEPASVLLERIAAERAAAESSGRKPRSKRAKSA